MEKVFTIATTYSKVTNKLFFLSNHLNQLLLYPINNNSNNMPA